MGRRFPSRRPPASRRRISTARPFIPGAASDWRTCCPTALSKPSARGANARFRQPTFLSSMKYPCCTRGCSTWSIRYAVSSATTGARSADCRSCCRVISSNCLPSRYPDGIMISSRRRRNSWPAESAMRKPGSIRRALSRNRWYGANCSRSSAI